MRWRRAARCTRGSSAPRVTRRNGDRLGQVEFRALRNSTPPHSATAAALLEARHPGPMRLRCGGPRRGPRREGVPARVATAQGRHEARDDSAPRHPDHLQRLRGRLLSPRGAAHQRHRSARRARRNGPMGWHAHGAISGWLVRRARSRHQPLPHPREPAVDMPRVPDGRARVHCGASRVRADPQVSGRGRCRARGARGPSTGRASGSSCSRPASRGSRVTAATR